MLLVVAVLNANPGQFEELRKLASGLVDATLAEPGCRGYRILTEAGQSNCLVFVELFVSSEAHSTHGGLEHVIRWRAESAPLIESRKLARCEVDATHPLVRLLIQEDA